MNNIHESGDLKHESFRPCPVCEGRQVASLHHQRFVLPEQHPLAGGYDVVHCLQCGAVYADVHAAQEDYDKYYAELSKYDDATNSTGSGESQIDRERLNGTAEILSKHLPVDARILDVGCAGGGLLAALQDRGYRNLIGIDPSRACALMTRERVGQAWQGWCGQFPSDIGRFDCVIFSHVLEHVLDVPGALAGLRPLLSAGGLVYIEVPDAARYASHLYAPFQEFNTEHINHFSRRCLDNTMGRQGFAATDGGERLLRPSAKTSMPAIYGIYHWTGERSQQMETDLKSAIQRYIGLSSDLLKIIDEFIAQVIQNSRELIVWGAGQLTLKLLAETCLGKATVVAFVDSNPIHQGRSLAGVPILAPAAIRFMSQPILIATLLHQEEISRQVAALGLTNEIICLPNC